MGSTLRITLAPLLASLLFTACGGYAASTSDTAELPPGSLAGVIELATDVEPGEFSSLLVMARRDPESVLPDLLRRMPVEPLPQSFVLDARHLLRAGKVQGSWHLSARLDSDGELLPAKGDVEAQLGPVDTDTTGHVLRLDTRVARTLSVEDADLPQNHPMLGDSSASAADAAQQSAPAVPREPGPRVVGRLELDNDFISRNGTGTLFLMLKSSTTARGMPRAALRVSNPQFPFDFDIGPEHVPLQVENKADLLAGTLYLSARLDFDGDALTKQAGDLESDILELQADQDPVQLALDRSRP